MEVNVVIFFSSRFHRRSLAVFLFSRQLEVFELAQATRLEIETRIDTKSTVQCFCELEEVNDDGIKN